MDDERQAVDAIATVLSREAVSVTTVGIKTIGINQRTALVMFPYIRRIDIGDMYRGILEVTRVDIESQHDDTVATMFTNEGVVVSSRVVNEARLVGLSQTPSRRVAFADRVGDGIVNLFPYIDMYVVDTIVTLGSLSAVLVVAGCGDVIQLMPCVRRLVLTDINRILSDVIGLMDEQVQAIDAIATECRVELVSIVTCGVQGVFSDLNTCLVMLPNERRINIRDVNGGIVEVTRVDIESQCNDTVATVDRGEGIIIKAAGVEEARLVCLR